MWKLVKNKGIFTTTSTAFFPLTQLIIELVPSLTDGRRNLEPNNFAKEIFCRVNLPPLHILKKTFIPEIVKMLVDDERMIFFRKLDGAVTSYVDRLKFETVSASIGNYRQKRENLSKLPIELFD